MNISPIKSFSPVKFSGIFKNESYRESSRIPTREEAETKGITDVDYEKENHYYYLGSDEVLTKDEFERLNGEYTHKSEELKEPYEYDGGTFRTLAYHNSQFILRGWLPYTQAELEKMSDAEQQCAIRKFESGDSYKIQNK